MAVVSHSRWVLIALAIAVSACTEETVEEALTGANSAPTISGTPTTSVMQNASYLFAPTASDADGDPIIFGIDARPPWASFNTVNGQLSGTPGAADVGAYRGIVVRVSDGKTDTLLPAFDLTVIAAPSQTNRAPTITGQAASAVAAGASFSFTPTANDADGDPLIFSIRNRPAWANFDTATGGLQGTPQFANAGTYQNIVISVSDGQSTVALTAFSIVVTIPAGNTAPVISGSPLTSVAAGSPYSFVPSASDADGNALTFTIANRPAWATFSTATGQLAGTPPAGTSGTFSNIVIGVSDGTASVSLSPFAITVTAVSTNRPPTITGAPATTVTQGQPYAFQPNASDADGDPLSFTIANRPSWASFSASTGRLSGTPGSTNIRTYGNIVISVSDGSVSTPLAAFSIAVSAANTLPTISGAPATTATVGTAYSFQPTANDADGDTLVYSIANRPAWTTFNTANGRLQGTPATANIGTFANIVVSVSDGQGSAQLPPFSIVTSAAPNAAPTISGTPPTTATVGTQYSFQPTASDADGNTLTFSATNVPSWATFTASTGRLQGTPATANVGTFGNIAISVSDGTVSTALAPFSIVVSNVPNVAPVISGTPPTTATVGTQYSFQPMASDADSDPLTYSITGRPSWATFNGSTGRLQGTPATDNVGTNSNIAISVSDGKVSTALAAFAIVVSAAANTPPTISGAPATTATVGAQYSFQPTASDADGNSLTFSIASRPSWATFTTATGRLQGTPAAGDVGTNGNIVISVSDGTVTVPLAAFSIVVSAAPNVAPTISGTPPASVMQGSQFTFQPSANDANGDTLTFSIANKPSWATFTTATGRLQGTPGPSDVGTTSNVVISVSDGQVSSSLAGFAITVQAVAFGSATLTWTPPTENTDGSPLSNLSGFKVYWGTSAGTYPNSTTLNNPGLTTYVVENLMPGTYYFVTTALTATGVESGYSNTASKTIQ